MILAGDIGGTRTRLALFAPGGPPRAPLREAVFASREHPSLEAIVRAFLSAGSERVTHAAFGIAGPVVEQRVEATNLPWTVAAGGMRDALDGALVTLINDLEANAWGLDTLGPGDFETLQPGTSRPGNGALIAAGTGLGEAILAHEGERWRPLPSEGGHADFGPRDPVEDELLVWLRARYGRVSYERILSGPGLADLYRFHAATGRGAEPDGFSARLEAAPDPAAAVSAAALDGSCERARLAVARFCSVYGAEAGNLALKALAVGGVFVGGGIAPRLLPFLRDGGFAAAFRAKGRLTPVVSDIPVAVILDDHTALWGAGAVARARGGADG